MASPRFALLGTLLGHWFSPEPGSGRSLLAAAGVAGAVVARAGLDYIRTVVAHRTAAIVQKHLARPALRQDRRTGASAWLAGERTGGVMLSVVDGVEQPQTFFGQYVPQVCVAALDPEIAIFLFIVWWDLPASRP